MFWYGIHCSELWLILSFYRYASDSRQSRGSHSSQGSYGGEITREKTSYTESAPPEQDQRSGSRTSSQSSMTRGSEGPPQSRQNEASNAPQQGSSTAPRQPQKSKGNSEFLLSKYQPIQ